MLKQKHGIVDLVHSKEVVDNAYEKFDEAVISATGVIKDNLLCEIHKQNPEDCMVMVGIIDDELNESGQTIVEIGGEMLDETFETIKSECPEVVTSDDPNQQDKENTIYNLLDKKNSYEYTKLFGKVLAEHPKRVTDIIRDVHSEKLLYKNYIRNEWFSDGVLALDSESIESFKQAVAHHCAVQFINNTFEASDTIDLVMSNMDKLESHYEQELGYEVEMDYILNNFDIGLEYMIEDKPTIICDYIMESKKEEFKRFLKQ